MTAALSLHDLTVGYGDRILISGCDAAFAPGTLTALIGRNGSGKSSLIRVMAGLDKPLRGSVYVGDTDIATMHPAERARAIALVTTERVRVANLRVRDLVAMGRAPYTNWIGHMRPEDRDTVMKSLELTGMAAYADRTLDRMSDGECQRVMIARALAQDTPVMLLDEPTSFLDLPNRYELCGLLRDLAENQGRTIVFSTHELDIALHLCHNIALVDPPRLHAMEAADPEAAEKIQKIFGIPGINFCPKQEK